MVWAAPPTRSPPLLTAISCLCRGSNSPYVAATTGVIYSKSSDGALTLSGPQEFRRVGCGRRFGHFEGASSTASATAEEGNCSVSSESLGLTECIDIVGEHNLWISDSGSATLGNSSSPEPPDYRRDSYTTMWKQHQQQQHSRWRPEGVPAPSTTVPGGAPRQPWRNPTSPHFGYNQAYPPLPRNGAYRDDKMQGRGWNQRDNRRWQDNRQGMREPRIDDCRYWLDSKEKFASGEKFLFLSYNILSADNAREHYGELYYHIPMRFVKWDWRKSRLTQEIEHWSPDILCLQEVDRFEDLQQELQKKGYAGIYKLRTGTATDGCATFWKHNRFLLLQEESVEFRELDLRDNVAQFCVLKSTSATDLSNTSDSTFNSDMSHRETTVRPKNCVVVANTHVLFNPKRGDIKLGQVRTLLDTAHELSAAWGGAQIIIAGDFNSTPSSPLYRFISTAELDVSSLDRRAISGQLADGEGYQSYRPNPRYLRQRYKQVSAARETSTAQNILTESARITSENGNGTVADQSTDLLEERHILAPAVESSGIIENNLVNEVVGIVAEQASKIDNLPMKTGDEHFDMNDIASVSMSKTQIATEVRSTSEYSLIQSSESVATLMHSSEGELLFEDAWERETGVSIIEAASREEANDKMEEMHCDTVSTSQNGYRHYGWTAEELQNATGSAECTKLSHKMKLRSAYSGIEGKAGSRDPTGEPLATTYHKKFMGTVDYIWHTEGLRPLRVLDILPVEALRRTGGLPTQKWGSDHLALVCELVFLGDQ